MECELQLAQNSATGQATTFDTEVTFGRVPKNTLMLTRSHSIRVGFTLQDSHLCVVSVRVGSHLIKLNTSLSLGH